MLLWWMNVLFGPLTCLVSHIKKMCLTEVIYILDGIRAVMPFFGWGVPLKCWRCGVSVTNCSVVGTLGIKRALSASPLRHPFCTCLHEESAVNFVQIYSFKEESGLKRSLYKLGHNFAAQIKIYLVKWKNS